MPEFGSNRIGIGGSLANPPAVPPAVADTTAYNRGVERFATGWQNAADIVLRAQLAIKEQRQRSDYAAGKVRAMQALDGVQDSLRDTTDWEGAPGLWSEAVGKARERFLDGISDPEVRDNLASDFDLMSIREGAAFKESMFKRESAYRVELFGSVENDLLTRYRAAQDQAGREDVLREHSQALADNRHWLEPGEIEKRSRTFLQAGEFWTAKDKLEKQGPGDWFRPNDYHHLPQQLQEQLHTASQNWTKTTGEQLYVEKAQGLGVGVEQQIRWVRENVPAVMREGVESRLWADASHHMSMADKARANAERNALNDVVKTLHEGGDPGAAMNRVETDPNISPAQKFEWRQHIANWKKAQSAQGDDPDTARSLWGRIGAEDQDKAKLSILQARLRGDITETTKDQMLQSVDQLADIYAPELKAIASMAHQAYSKGLDVPGDTASVAAEARVNQYARLLASDMRAKGKTLLEIKQALSPETFAPPIIEQFRPNVQEQFAAWARRTAGGAASVTPPMPKPTEQTPSDSSRVPLTTDKPVPEASWPVSGTTVDEGLALRLLNAAGGDRQKARELARQKGYVIPN